MRKRVSIKKRIIFSIIGIISVTGVAAAVIIFFVADKNFAAIRAEDINAATIEQAYEIGQLFDNPRKLIDASAKQYVIVDYLAQDPQIQDPTIVDALHHFDVGGIFERITILSNEGVALVSTDPNITGSNHLVRSYFTRAIMGVAAIEVSVDKETGKLGYFFSAPILMHDGSVAGVLVGRIPQDTINTLLGNSVLAGKGTIMLIDVDGVVISSNNGERIYKSIGPLSQEKKSEITFSERFAGRLIGELQYGPVVDVIRSYTEPVVLDFYDSVDGSAEIISIARTPGAPFFIIFETSSGLLTGPALIIVVVLTIAAFFSALFAGLLVFLFSVRFLRPLRLFKDAAERISSGDYSYRLELTTGDEFEDVASAFNAMALQMQASYSNLEQIVVEKTKAVLGQLQEVEKKNVALQDTQRAVLNVLEDARILEIQLQEERDQLKGILASMGEGLFVFDKDFRVLLVNTTAESILGIPREQIVGKSIIDLITVYHGKTVIQTQERPIFKIVSEAKAVDIDIKDDLYWEIQGGKKFAVGFAGAPMFVGGLTGGVIIFRDLTLEKNLDDARTSFISITSHQLRTPLTSLKWFLEMLMDGSYAQPLTPEQKNFADLSYQAANRMMGIINLLLQIARVEAGRVKVVPVPTNLRTFTQSIVTSFGNIFDVKKQKVEIVAIPDVLPDVSIDTDIVGQVLQNLISNANRYALDDTTITITLAVKGNQMHYSIANKGIGITKSDAARIFEKFYRAENALRMVPEGSGLGLALVKSLVEGWGGTIWFESKEFEGATFHFTIPLAGMISREGEVGIRTS